MSKDRRAFLRALLCRFSSSPFRIREHSRRHCAIHTKSEHWFAPKVAHFPAFARPVMGMQRHDTANKHDGCQPIVINHRPLGAHPCGRPQRAGASPAPTCRNVSVLHAKPSVRIVKICDSGLSACFGDVGASGSISAGAYKPGTIAPVSYIHQIS